jgi:putative SOS response-associated peptidase YedK
MSHGGNNHYRRLAAFRAADAERAAQAAQSRADSLSIIAWNERMWIGGPAQPSPTIGMAIEQGYRYLRVRCSCCRTLAWVELKKIRRAPETPVWKLEGGLYCSLCRDRGERAPRGIIERLTFQTSLTPEDDGAEPDEADMCNLYSVTKGQAAIIAFVKALRDMTGNLPPLPGVFPDYLAPIARTGTDGVRELAIARWGMPGPSQFGGAPITNVRNTASPHWRAWLQPEHRCVVPFTSFCEYADTKPKKTPTWFAFSDDRPLAVFAGIWTTWRGRRGTKANPIEGEHQLFGFLTTDANADVFPTHPKAMPVILRTPEEVEQWMTAPVAEALDLQRPLPSDTLKIVAQGEKEDPQSGLFPLIRKNSP